MNGEPKVVGLRQDVQQMIEREGLYLAFDPKRPAVIVPIVSQGGKLFTMRIDSVLAPDKFFHRTDLHGPFWPSEFNRLPKQ